MNASINYSGFTDLLVNFASENNAGAAQTEDRKPEPAMERTVKNGNGIRHDPPAESGPDR